MRLFVRKNKNRRYHKKMNFIEEYQINLIFRMLVSCVCGILIGFERKNRAKVAGIRTHCIVACASAMMMIVSKYAFHDIIETAANTDVRLDPSRMAQGIVTGVGFLGAGMIYIQRGVIRGLTTAAGIWATSGIGMAIGGGMYIIGITGTIIILCIQLVLHIDSKLLSTHKTKTIKIHHVSESGFQEKAKELFAAINVGVNDVSVRKNEDGTYTYAICIDVPEETSEEFLVNQFDYRCSIDFTN